MPDIDELIADDQAIGAAEYDELEDNDYIMLMMQDTGGSDECRSGNAGDENERGGESGAEGSGSGGQGTAESGDSAAEESEWREMMEEGSEGEGSGGQSMSSMAGGGSSAGAMVGVGRARERAGPGKWRRVATLARWEPSARARMQSQLESATIDVTGD